jgi:hypothetical protein
MWVLFAEAFGAVVVLVLIVWWTMFHGRKNGERSDTAADGFKAAEKPRR